MSIRILPDGTIETDTPDEALAVARGMAQAIADSMPVPGPSEEEPVTDPEVETVPDEPSEEVQRAVRVERYRAAEARLTKLMFDTLVIVRDYPDGITVAGLAREITARTGRPMNNATANGRLTKLLAAGLIRRIGNGTYAPVEPEDFTK